jgi:uncharacterized protein
MTTVTAERITFRTEGVELVGDLRLAGSGDRRPAVALTGPLTGIKEQVTGIYAELLARAGITTLAFDHRGFGESGGRRQHEDSQGKLADLRAAVSVLAAREEVDPARIGLAGICLGGGYAIRAAAVDPRVKAVATIAGGYNSPAHMAGAMGIDAYRAALAAALERYEYLPAVAPGGKEILWLDASQHIDLYDQDPHVSQAAEAAVGFLHRKLVHSAK